MRDPRIRKYNKKFEYSYAMGTFPTIDLLKSLPNIVMKVLINPLGERDPQVLEVISLCKENGVRYEFSKELIEKISVKENTYTVGIFEKYRNQLNEKENHIVLFEPKNMGNIGTIIRSMVGFGFKNLAIIKPAADIFDPMVVRSTMGSLFKIRFSYFDTYEKYSEMFKRDKYLFVMNGSNNIEEIEFKKPFSLIFGNESTGLPENIENDGIKVKIRHSDELESLNLSVAASIGMYVSSKV